MVECKRECCKLWVDKQSEVLMQCESIFDAVVDMYKFEEECFVNCPYKDLGK